MSGILTLQQRIREIGRIRIGQKGAKGQPQKLTTFRFTSFDKRTIEAASKLWGGTVKPCVDSDLKGQWEVVTNASEIPIMASPTEPTQYMELWSGGGCKRRCNGREDLISGGVCQCDPESPECKPTTRLSVILPDLPGLGVWRLESHGWNAAQELIQTYEFLRDLTRGNQFPEAMLAVEERTSRSDGTTKRFMVPVIRLTMTPRELLAAQAQASLAREPVASNPGLPPSRAQLPPPNHEAPGHVLKDPNPRGAVFAIAAEMGLPPHEGAHKLMYYAVFGKVVGRAFESLSVLTDDEWQKLATWMREVQSGKAKNPKAFQDAIAARVAEQPFDPMAEDEPEVFQPEIVEESA